MGLNPVHPDLGGQLCRPEVLETAGRGDDPADGVGVRLLEVALVDVGLELLRGFRILSLVAGVARGETELAGVDAQEEGDEDDGEAADTATDRDPATSSSTPSAAPGHTAGVESAARPECHNRRPSGGWVARASGHSPHALPGLLYCAAPRLVRPTQA